MIDALLRIFSLLTTRAVCPTLRRLGTLVVQDAVLDWAAVAVAGTIVGVSAIAVGVASVATIVGVGDAGTKVDVDVGGMGDGLEISAVFEAVTASVEADSEVLASVG